MALSIPFGHTPFFELDLGGVSSSSYSGSLSACKRLTASRLVRRIRRDQAGRGQVFEAAAFL